jgi:hypothetical protein
MIGFIDTYTFTQFGTTGNCSAIAILHTFQFTVAHTLGFSVFTSRIPATDISQSHCPFNTHMTSSWHSLIPLLPFSAASNSEDSTQFSSDYSSVLLQLLNSQFQFPNSISLATNRLSLHSLVTYTIEIAMFTAPLPSNEYPSIVACTFVAEMFLSCHCLAVGRYVTIYSYSTCSVFFSEKLSEVNGPYYCSHCN